MFKNILNKARELATPERIEAIRSSAAKATDAAKYGAGVAQGFVAQTVEGRKQRQQAELDAISHAPQAPGKAGETRRTDIEDLHPDVQRVLQAHANIRSALETDTRVRGASLIDLTTPQSQQLLRSKTPAGALTIGGVPIDFGDEQQHILLSGAPGTGKSVEIKKALRTIRQRKQKAVVYDPSGEFTSMFYRPGYDVILNPLDERNVRWNPWADSESFEYAAFAKSLIPDRGENADAFWVESGRAVIETLLLECKSLDDLIYMGLSAPIPELAKLVAKAGFGGMVGPEKTFQSTRATLSVYLRSLALLDNVQRDDDTFSFKKWLKTDDTNDAWVFLPVPTRARDALRPVVSMLLDTAVRHIMSLRPDPDRRIWLVIDELPSLQNIPSIHPALAEGRKYGIGGILGVQTFHQLKKTFGDAGAAALWGLPKTRLYLRISDAETCEMVSKEIGESQLKRKTTSTSESESVSNSRGGGSDSTSSSTSESEQTVTERIVFPAEIGGLPDLLGYLRTGGSLRVAKVKVEFDGLPRQGDQDDFVWRAQRPLPKRPVAKVEVPEQQQVVQEVVQLNQEESVENQKAAVSAESYQDRLSALASALMREAFERWEPGAIAALTEEEMAELSGIFVERAEIALTNAGHQPA
jgi:hypothetical protein